MPQIIQRLAEHGVSAERKSIYADLDALREFGIDVRTYRTSPVEYGIVPDEFSLEELMVMVDAVQSCRAITQRQADSLVRSIKRLTNKEDREVLDRCIHVEGRIKSKSDSVLSTVDKIHDAIRSKSSVTLVYKRASSVDRTSKPSRGKKHKVTPIEVAYDDGFYYLTAWDEDSKDIREFRLDRIRGMIAGEPGSATANEQIRAMGGTGATPSCSAGSAARRSRPRSRLSPTRSRSSQTDSARRRGSLAAAGIAARAVAARPRTWARHA